MLQTKPVTCRHCSAVNKHHSFQCSTIRKPIKRKEVKTEPKAVKRAPIKKVSDKRAKELRVYAKISKAFKLDNPYCHAGLPGCTTITQDVHHQRGKEGARLNDKMYFLPVCRSCHQQIELNPVKAKGLNLSYNRLIF